MHFFFYMILPSVIAQVFKQKAKTKTYKTSWTQQKLHWVKTYTKKPKQ